MAENVLQQTKTQPRVSVAGTDVVVASNPSRIAARRNPQIDDDRVVLSLLQPFGCVGRGQGEVEFVLAGEMNGDGQRGHLIESVVFDPEDAPLHGSILSASGSARTALVTYGAV